MLYLADQYDKDHKISFEHGTGDYYEMLSWLMFQMVAAPSKPIINC
jgi:glutathione S-transferase